MPLAAYMECTMPYVMPTDLPKPRKTDSLSKELESLLLALLEYGVLPKIA
jgi:hypothetical protein